MDIKKLRYATAVTNWLSIILGVDPMLVTNPSCHRAEVVDARRCVAKYMMDKMGVTVYEAAWLLGSGQPRAARLGKGMFRFNGEQEWLKTLDLPFKVH